MNNEEHSWTFYCMCICVKHQLIRIYLILQLCTIILFEYTKFYSRSRRLCPRMRTHVPGPYRLICREYCTCKNALGYQGLLKTLPPFMKGKNKKIKKSARPPPTITVFQSSNRTDPANHLVLQSYHLSSGSNPFHNDPDHL